jgi:hypothetical protein
MSSGKYCGPSGKVSSSTLRISGKFSLSFAEIGITPANGYAF